jgi:predicted DNA-binding protein
MADTVNARIPPRLEQRLAEYCARQGVTRSAAVLRALEQYLDQAAGGKDAFALAADLIPEKGDPRLRSDRARELARNAFRGPRAR